MPGSADERSRRGGKSAGVEMLEEAAEMRSDDQGMGHSRLRSKGWRPWLTACSWGDYSSGWLRSSGGRDRRVTGGQGIDWPGF